MVNRTLDVEWVDWEVCRRALVGDDPGRQLTLAERAVVYRAVISAGGTPNKVATMLRIGSKYLSQIVRFVESTGGVEGSPVVDGVVLTWTGRPTSGCR